MADINKIEMYIYTKSSNWGRRHLAKQYTSCRKKGCCYSSWWSTIIIKYSRLSHDVVTCDVDRDVSTACCWSSSGDEVDCLRVTFYGGCSAVIGWLHQSQLLKTNQSQRSILRKRWRVTSRPHRLMKTSSMQSKRRDLHHKWPHRETNENTLLIHFFFFTRTSTFE